MAIDQLLILAHQASSDIGIRCVRCQGATHYSADEPLRLQRLCHRCAHEAAEQLGRGLLELASSAVEHGKAREEAARAERERDRLAAQIDAGPPWLEDIAEALGKIAPSGKPLALNWTQALEAVRQLRRDLLEVCAIATTPMPEDREVVNQARRRWL